MSHHIDPPPLFNNWQCLSVFASQNYLMIYGSNLRPGLMKLINLMRVWLAYCDFLHPSPTFPVLPGRVTSFSTSCWTFPNPFFALCTFWTCRRVGWIDSSLRGWLAAEIFLHRKWLSRKKAYPLVNLHLGSFPSAANLIHCKPMCRVIVQSSAFVFGCTDFYIFGGRGQSGDLFEWQVQVHGPRPLTSPCCILINYSFPQQSLSLPLPPLLSQRCWLCFI